MANQYTKKAAAKKDAAPTPLEPRLPRSSMDNLPPKFVLQPSDNLATLVVNYWLQLAKENQVPALKLASARKRLAEMEEYRRLNPVLCKLPD